MVEGDVGDLRFLISPDLRQSVQDADWEYVDFLLKDFQTRARQDPESLFRQLAALSVGPLTTHEVGSFLEDYPSLQKLSEQFVLLQ